MEFKLNEAIEVLEQTPAVLAALLAGKSAAWLQARKAPDAFSPIDVLGHLIHGELTDWIPRVRIILEHQDKQTFEPFDRFAFQPILSGKSIDNLLEEFASLRRWSLDELRAMNVHPAQLELPGMHPELGRVNLRQHIANWAVHDLGHIAQIVKAMAAQYRDQTGPWRAYTPILD